MTTSTLSVANTILAQLGGSRFLAMTGAKNLVGGERSLQFSIGRGAKNKANKVRITLTPADFYTVEFFKFSPRSLECPVVSEADGVDAEALRRVFTAHTGFETSL